MSLLQKLFNISNSEWKPAVFSFLYFLCMMASYFILRPVRDEMGIQAGIENMQWLFTGTFIAMLLTVPLFGFFVKKVSRKKLLPAIYLFFSLNILAFYFAFQSFESGIIPVLFFIWLSVYNLFVISIFWSFNADIFTPSQAKRLFGPIAAGGSIGAILGPSLTAYLSGKVGVLNLLLISTLLLVLSSVFLTMLLKGSAGGTQKKLSKPMDGSVWAGFKLILKSPMLAQISFFILMYTSISTFLYFQQGHIISSEYTSSEVRTSYFGLRDLLVNSITLFLQFFLTEKVIRKWGLTLCLITVPLISAIGFFMLGMSPTVYVLLTFQVLYRSFNFALQRPAREILFTSVGDEERYKSKNFIDTTIYRGGDAVSGWIFAGLSTVFVSLQVISFVIIPVAILWILSGMKIGKLFNHLNKPSYETFEPPIIATKSA